jgi:hypothetical protein
MKYNASPLDHFKQDGNPDWKDIAIKLWSLLDDIDTSTDIFKENYEGCCKYMARKANERHKYIVSDGYDLFARQQDKQ